MQTKIKKFNDLTLLEYHQLMKIRTSVFVVEQNCPYQEVDDVDLTAFHFWLENQKEMVAYARVYQQQQTIHFGRVLVKKEERDKGLGKQLMQQLMGWIEQNFPEKIIHIEAQAYLQEFYTSFGFRAVSEKYLLDGISHIDMQKG
ncbi:GNAT family N-acetyltransferase [Tetragenococcus osmophilus]|uniref:Acetyltransferase n=1 Tax=Tetragenococcus osmophilus TaxID=526944 RepID=A0AA37XMJ0_9ENTE|nr:GNAT family N-acetyltransferase [Tetragenococcus osmophilus]AYW47746.1 GNAT family N-acetyltransferase [Tetragenococcus osmophilus]GMA53413.1 acetyltransferase [Alicyclobacillus contaminans]GMA72635.1 acetyltransferase [Tetragenococcus osmophilus]